MTLPDLWFLIIAFLWTGFFVLEGFDFGVGMLHKVVGRTDTEQRVAINAIGPFWDGNEVWLIVAGAAMFAAFPGWYATLFSGLYLALLLVLVALMARGASFEFGDKVRSPRWRRTWTWATTLSSGALPLLLGIGLGGMVAGFPIDSDGEYSGGVIDMFTAYGVWTGLTLLSLSVLHGATFLALKTDGPVRADARRVAGRAGLVTVAVAGVFLLWTQFAYGSGPTWATAALAAVALVGALVGNARGREGWAFLATAVTIVLATATLFANLYPYVLPSTVDPSFGLTVDNASSTPYTLRIMTWVAVGFTPIVLLYQGWTYWVFRKRLTVTDIPTGSS